MQTLPKLKSKAIIRLVLGYQDNGVFLATHEICNQARGLGFYLSDNACATRLNELERAGEVESCYRDGKRFKEWAIVRTGNNGEPLPKNYNEDKDER